ncbi:hypothetical protein niasHS_004988 [Heterodera schachtii]|uniref:Transmembrane protein n=1 Tax=Heterodera schachtii TaxID=97005 RepID=A0ABD2JQR5_HETSC
MGTKCEGEMQREKWHKWGAQRWGDTRGGGHITGEKWGGGKRPGEFGLPQIRSFPSNDRRFSSAVRFGGVLFRPSHCRWSDRRFCAASGVLHAGKAPHPLFIASFPLIHVPAVSRSPPFTLFALPFLPFLSFIISRFALIFSSFIHPSLLVRNFVHSSPSSPFVRSTDIRG